jgi:hypothetical protein
MDDTNAITRAYLVTQAALTALVGGASPRIHCPSLPEGTVLPAISYFTRGGGSTPYIPPIVEPSVQFSCWADNPITARQIYGKLYDALQGIQNIAVTIGATTYYILSAIEEVQGQDLQEEIPNYFRVLTFFRIKIRT